jgi:hypothetical protein
MARALTAVGAALALAILVLGLVIYLNRDEDAIAVDNLLAENITREIGTVEQRGEDTVDLADVTDFDWDQVLIAAPDATDAEIGDALGADWKGELEFRTGDLLIFVRNGHVARFADYRGEGRFAGLKRPVARLARDDAKFSVRSLVIRPLREPPTSSP